MNYSTQKVSHEPICGCLHKMLELLALKKIILSSDASRSQTNKRNTYMNKIGYTNNRSCYHDSFNAVSLSSTDCLLLTAPLRSASSDQVPEDTPADSPVRIQFSIRNLSILIYLLLALIRLGVDDEVSVI